MNRFDPVPPVAPASPKLSADNCQTGVPSSMTERDVREWLETHDAFIDELEALDLEIGRLGGKALEAVAALRAAAEQLLVASARGQSLPLIPDADSSSHLVAGFARYTDAAEMIIGVCDRTHAEVERSAPTLEAGTEEFLPGGGRGKARDRPSDRSRQPLLVGRGAPRPQHSWSHLRESSS